MALFNKFTINLDEKVLELINRRRRQILVHSYLYYELSTNIISDTTFDAWCKELVQLQSNYPKESEKAVFADVFRDWTGFSGYDLIPKCDKTTKLWANKKAKQLSPTL